MSRWGTPIYRNDPLEDPGQPTWANPSARKIVGDGGVEPDTSVFITKDSGAREEFESGARRDTQDGKPRYDLIPAGPLKRLADQMARGAVKYGEDNWTKGMPASRFLASLMRHVEAYRLGDREEDHLAAAVFNAFAIMEFEGSRWDDINKEST